MQTFSSDTAFYLLPQLALIANQIYLKTVINVRLKEKYSCG